MNQALTLFRSLNTRWQLGRTWFELGELAVAQGESFKARDCFQHALRLFEAMRAAPDIERAHLAMQALRL